VTARAARVIMMSGKSSACKRQRSAANVCATHEISSRFCGVLIHCAIVVVGDVLVSPFSK
jgi:hypothetical protein